VRTTPCRIAICLLAPRLGNGIGTGDLRMDGGRNWRNRRFREQSATYRITRRTAATTCARFNRAAVCLLKEIGTTGGGTPTARLGAVRVFNSHRVSRNAFHSGQCNQIDFVEIQQVQLTFAGTVGGNYEPQRRGSWARSQILSNQSQTSRSTVPPPFSHTAASRLLERPQPQRLVAGFIVQFGHRSIA
jgi:hypothetical protein